MPTYDYHCANCGKKTEVFQKISEEPIKECPSCHKQTLKRGPGGGIGINFTGSGFYKTDYASEKPPQGDSKGSCCPCGKNGGSCH